MKSLRLNVLAFAGMSTAIVAMFAVAGAPAPVVAGIAGGALGWFASVARSLIAAPDGPTVEVPASFFERLAGLSPEAAEIVTGFRWNVFILALLSTGIVALLAYFYWSTAPEIVAGAGGTVMGWFAGAARDLVVTPPEQSVEVPVSTLHALAERRPAGTG